MGGSESCPSLAMMPSNLAAFSRGDGCVLALAFRRMKKMEVWRLECYQGDPFIPHNRHPLK